MQDTISISPRRRQRQKGSSLVELCLCFLGFLLLTIGTMEFAMATYAYNFCSYAARDASRWASVHGSLSQTATTCTSSQGVADGCPANSTDVQNFVAAEAIALTPSNLNVTTSWTNNAPGGEVTVTVAYTVVPLAGLALRQNLNVSGTSQVEVVH